MATTIKLKNSVTTTNAPSSLEQGEVAVNVTDKKVWVGNAATSPVQLLGTGADGSLSTLTVGAGTVSAPAITTTGDTNTGIYFPSADTIAFSEGNSEVMRITSDGLVGIGTSSPNAKLFVAATVGASIPSLGAPSSHLAVGNGNNFGTMIGTISNGVGYIQQQRFDGTATAYALSLQPNGGDVGIGTSSPSQKLHVYTATGAVTGKVQSGNTGQAAIIAQNSRDYVQIAVDSSACYLDAGTTSPLLFATGSSERMRITSGGEVYIAGTTDRGAYNLQCNGTGVWGAGAYVNGSDARIKENVAPIESGLDVVEKLNPVTYRYKEDWSKDQSTQTGFIAQELLTALEGQVYVDGVVQQGGEYMSVAYQNIIPILTKAIQEQQAIITDLKSRIEALENK
jgi:Chaperone of endosialidase